LGSSVNTSESPDPKFTVFVYVDRL